MKDRRNLLKGLAVGSVWAAPVVQSFVLPVHAEMTVEEPPTTGVTCSLAPELMLTCSDAAVSQILYYRIVSSSEGCMIESADEKNAGEGVFWAGVFSDITGDNQFQAELNYNVSTSRDFRNLGIEFCSSIVDESGTLTIEVMDSAGTYAYEVSAPYEFDSAAKTVTLGTITAVRL